MSLSTHEYAALDPRFSVDGSRHDERPGRLRSVHAWLLFAVAAVAGIGAVGWRWVSHDSVDKAEMVTADSGSGRNRQTAANVADQLQPSLTMVSLTADDTHAAEPFRDVDAPVSTWSAVDRLASLRQQLAVSTERGAARVTLIEEIGDELYDTYRFADAAEVYQSAVDQTGRDLSPIAISRHAYCLYHLDRNPEADRRAIAALEQLTTDRQPNAEVTADAETTEAVRLATLVRGLNAYTDDRFADAIRLLTRCLIPGDDSWEQIAALDGLAQSLEQLGSSDAALARYRELSEIETLSIDEWFNASMGIARSLDRLDRVEEAVEELIYLLTPEESDDGYDPELDLTDLQLDEALTLRAELYDVLGRRKKAAADRRWVRSLEVADDR